MKHKGNKLALFSLCAQQNRNHTWTTRETVCMLIFLGDNLTCFEQPQHAMLIILRGFRNVIMKCSFFRKFATPNGRKESHSVKYVAYPGEPNRRLFVFVTFDFTLQRRRQPPHGSKKRNREAARSCIVGDRHFGLRRTHVFHCWMM